MCPQKTKGCRVLCVIEEKTFAWRGLKVNSNVITEYKGIYSITCYGGKDIFVERVKG